jgi:hypothetical protein
MVVQCKFLPLLGGEEEGVKKHYELTGPHLSPPLEGRMS